LLESELFGYEKGAFTGATKQTRGKIEFAVGGTFFLDEVGDLPFSLQAKLLRFLQERTIERVGGRQEIAVDVRVICATHQNFEKLLAEGRFREDLYYRISEITLQIPPLRERGGDILVIARTLVKSLSQRFGKKVAGLHTEALAAISAHPWPGNIRELENRIKRAVIMSEQRYLTPEDLELESRDAGELPFNLRTVREGVEKEIINRAIGFTDNNISKTADLLGVTRPTLYSLMHKYGIIE
jgi:two-component system NtrC family response regulator